MDMTPDRWSYTCRYLTETFGGADAELEALRSQAAKAGLPEIAISADVGALLRLLVGLSGGQTAVEVGTLGGYSAAWIARGLRDGGRLFTIEADAHHADFARGQMERLGLEERVDVREGLALEVLPDLAAELGPASTDFVFLDAVKSEYPEYLAALRSTLKPGALLVADNVLGAGEWWIDQEGHASRDAVAAFNRQVAEDPAFEAAAVPLREGVLVARFLG